MISSLYESIVKPLLFKLDPETAHETIGAFARRFDQLPFAAGFLDSLFQIKSERLASTVAGIQFPNPVGMAAGFDKTGELYPFLAHLGFGFVESGTFTAHAQDGNEKPRLFRFPAEEALVNRMGFNNPGSERAALTIARQKRTVPRGINIGKSKLTSLDEAAWDYQTSLERLVSGADYLAVNVSSPNTPELRKLQEKGRLRTLLMVLKRKLNNRCPLFVKIAPDLADKDFDDVLGVVQSLALDGMIVSNTSVDRTLLPAAADKEGGISGAPLRARSTELIRRVRKSLPKISIIGVGGISAGEHALEKIEAGANLIQVYTGFIYQGPETALRINRWLDNVCKERSCNIADLVGR